MKKVNNTTKRFADAFSYAYHRALVEYCFDNIGENLYYDLDILLNNRGLFYGFFHNARVEAEITSHIIEKVAFLLVRPTEEVEPAVRDYINTHHFGGLSYIDNLWESFNRLCR